jgi:hypothetical protein
MNVAKEGFSELGHHLVLEPPMCLFLVFLHLRACVCQASALSLSHVLSPSSVCLIPSCHTCILPVCFCSTVTIKLCQHLIRTSYLKWSLVGVTNQPSLIALWDFTAAGFRGECNQVTWPQSLIEAFFFLATDTLGSLL